jgi:hypothetical protein
MFGSVKKILGIEGVKLELIIPLEISKESLNIVGTIKLTSLSDNQLIESIHLTMVEKYSRGRGENKLINEYTLGEMTLNNPIKISKEDIIEVPFEMSFISGKSEMDRIADSNFFARGIVGLAKKLSAVSSVYTLRAEAHVKGTKLHPFDKKVIEIRR